MFDKILVANRGEIAVRIIETCREMDITTVAVYSQADRYARHVREADEAYYIGPAPAAQSYLHIDAIIEVAQRSGAQAIHPGYGFLSENAAFVDACEQAGIVFIGPPAAAMRLMGSKIAAKQLAQTVGTPTVPGYDGESQQDDILLYEAQHIGFPLLIKASAGGGGKGMRIVHTADDFLDQLAGARREALAAFGDATVFLERLIQKPRHIEIQILGDMHGQLIHLGERECSIQRRHQKILEESPSSALTAELRAAMGAAAVRIAQAAHYTNAGTIEFMLNDDQRFYFLEMNTRLQVEHPVTELVTGLDLVRHQLRIAAGEPLGITQEQISPRGHALEVRLYAEDPAQNFLPSTGIITHFVKPQGPGIRLDYGVDSGDEITQYYDPMLAKLIVHAEDRPTAIARLQHALEQCIIFGVTTNITLLHAISIHPAFRAGHTPTSFLEDYELVPIKPALVAQLSDEVLLVAAYYDLQHDLTGTTTQSVINGYKQVQTEALSPWHQFGPWRMAGGTRTITYIYQQQTHTVTLQPVYHQPATWQIQVDTNPTEEITGILNADNFILLKRAATQVRAYVQQQKSLTLVAFAGETYALKRRQAPDVAAAAQTGGPISRQKMLTAPMAGTIIKVQVHAGDTVEAQQVLLVLSAMKMEHTIAAPYAGKVGRILYQEGSVVPGGAIVAEMA